MSGLVTTRTNVHDLVCGWCRECNICHKCQKDNIYANCQGNYGTSSRDCEIWKKEIDYQTKTYTKYHLPRSKKDGRDYKIHESDKNIFQQTSATVKPKVVAQLVNKTRALIQEMKTVIEAVSEKLSKDPVATSPERQANRKSSGSSHF